MDLTAIFFWGALFLIIIRFAVFCYLEILNIRSVKKHQHIAPPVAASENKMTAAAYQRSLAYTLEKSYLAILGSLWGNAWLVVVLSFGALNAWSSWINPAFQAWQLPILGNSLYVLGFFFIYGLLGLPFSLYSTFNVEARYGFNTITWGLYVKDALKSFVISLGLTLPLLMGLFWVYAQLGVYWWIYGATLLIGFQFLMQIIFPKFILPLFNKLTPLPAGKLRDEIFALAHRTKFKTQNILIMDGSKRSKHSNAFFTGIGKSRMIVLFDTLVNQLSILELKAVLAHEVGHYKKKHILKGLFFSLGGTFLTFYVLALLVQTPQFSEAFSLTGGEIAHTLILVSLLSGTITFYLKPLFNARSRKHEYEADAYAKSFTGGKPLVGALKKLYKENLSNLHPHPLYSFFYYSHPTLSERAAKLLAKT